MHFFFPPLEWGKRIGRTLKEKQEEKNVKELGAGYWITLEVKGDIWEIPFWVRVPKHPRHSHFILHPDLAIFPFGKSYLYR